MTDTMKDNPGEKLGGLVEAKVGKGRWIYLGLNFWRQLPQGTPGAVSIDGEPARAAEGAGGGARPQVVSQARAARARRAGQGISRFVLRR
jgi:hypothetical protein